MGVNLLSQTVGEDSLQNRVNTRPRGFSPTERARTTRTANRENRRFMRF